MGDGRSLGKQEGYGEHKYALSLLSNVEKQQQQKRPELCLVNLENRSWHLSASLSFFIAGYIFLSNMWMGNIEGTIKELFGSAWTKRWDMEVRVKHFTNPAKDKNRGCPTDVKSFVQSTNDDR